MTNLSSLRSSGLRIIATNTYSANDTWTKPSGAVLVRVVACGGGGSGRRPAAGAGSSAGGSAAPFVEMWFPASVLNGTEAIVVGVGGAAIAVTGTDGSNGGYSAFGAWLEAAGGSGAVGTQAFAPFNANYPSISGGPVDAVARGANNRPGGGNGFDGISGVVGGGGGAAGSNNSSAGGAGGASQRYRSGTNATSLNGAAGGTSGGAIGGNGTAGANGSISGMLGGGGGGAGGGGTVTGGNGATGGVPGGGGGAGGFGTTTSGNSGAGGDGRVFVETWG
jgi:hypothetical protein